LPCSGDVVLETCSVQVQAGSSVQLRVQLLTTDVGVQRLWIPRIEVAVAAPAEHLEVLIDDGEVILCSLVNTTST
jgi:hypothetical protein